CWSRRFLLFFQADDGIRDFHVTGVQTCALPILAFRKKIGSNIEIASTLSNLGRLKLTAGDLVAAEKYLLDAEQRIDTAHRTAYRSEERRVGKECRTERAPNH